MYVCLCHGVSDRKIVQLADQGVSTLDELAERTQLGTCCGCCQDVAAVILQQASCAAVEVRAPRALPVMSPA